MLIKRTNKIDAPQGATPAVARKSQIRRATLRQLHESAAHVPAARNDLSPDLQIERVAIGSLKPAPRRVRRADPAQTARVMTSIRKFGLCDPLLITKDREIVDGHAIWEAARQLGIAEVSCVVVDHLGPADIRMLRIALNRLGERGAWDLDALQIEFQELEMMNEDLVVTGFETAEIDMILMGDIAETPEEEADSIPEVGKTAISRPGDVWLLGDHKLIQGDSRDPACYERLMGEAGAARLLLTDVPYNISVREITGDGRHREFAMASGEMNRDEFVRFNSAWMTAAADRLVDGGIISTAIDWRNIDVVMEAARSLGLTHLNTAVWSKTNAGQGSLWRSAHELYPFFRKGTAPHINNIELGRHGRWRSNVWVYPGGSSLGSDSREGLNLHPTVKPRALIEDVLMDITHRGDVVIDCFCGSGSTVVAAQATGRRCMAIEIDDLYCDIIVKRWQDTTGEDAVLEATGETFRSTAADRADDDKPTRSEPRKGSNA